MKHVRARTGETARHPVHHGGQALVLIGLRGQNVDLPELIATKIRALFQRKKGRDLFDLWLAIHHAGAPIAEIAACFEPYRPDGWNVDRALENLDAKLSDRTFTTDLDALVADWPDGYSIESASRTVIDLLELLR